MRQALSFVMIAMLVGCRMQSDQYRHARTSPPLGAAQPAPGDAIPASKTSPLPAAPSPGPQEGPSPGAEPQQALELEGPAPASSPEAPAEPASTDDALAYIKAECAACHDSKAGAVASFWSLNKDEITRDSLANDQMAPNVYYALLAKSRGLEGGQPSPMPPSKLDAAELAKLKRVVKWFEKELPAVASVARAKFQGAAADPDETGIVIEFACKELKTTRELLTRLTQDFFDRPPTAAELSLFSDLDKTVTRDARTKMAARLGEASGWKDELERVGLRKLARKLGGASAIKPTAGISAVQAEDLKDEMYRLLLGGYDKIPYAKLLLDTDLQVTAQTAPLYGCNAPSGAWGACAQRAPRGSYFTSLSFLLSKPSTYLSENNNYGRTKLLHFLISGDVFKSAFDAPAGETSVRPLPSCLKTKDWRGTYNATKTHVAAYGTALVPASGNFCQSCHIARHMAAGSLVFRPYAASGLLYGSQTGVLFDPLLDEATGELHVYKDAGGQYQRVTRGFLEALLTDSGEQACAVPFGGGEPKTVRTVRDLAEVLIGDGRILASGLARHLPRALSNAPTTTEEVVAVVMQAYAKSGLLSDVLKAYAASETYACKVR